MLQGTCRNGSYGLRVLRGELVERGVFKSLCAGLPGTRIELGYVRKYEYIVTKDVKAISDAVLCVGWALDLEADASRSTPRTSSARDIRLPTPCVVPDLVRVIDVVIL